MFGVRFALGLEFHGGTIVQPRIRILGLDSGGHRRAVTGLDVYRHVHDGINHCTFALGNIGAKARRAVTDGRLGRLIGHTHRSEQHRHRPAPARP